MTIGAFSVAALVGRAGEDDQGIPSRVRRLSRRPPWLPRDGALHASLTGIPRRGFMGSSTSSGASTRTVRSGESSGLLSSVIGAFYTCASSCRCTSGIRGRRGARLARAGRGARNRHRRGVDAVDSPLPGGLLASSSGSAESLHQTVKLSSVRSRVKQKVARWFGPSPRSFRRVSAVSEVRCPSDGSVLLARAGAAADSGSSGSEADPVPKPLAP